MGIFSKSNPMWAYYVKVRSGKKGVTPTMSYYYPLRNLLKFLKGFEFDYGDKIEIMPVNKEYLPDSTKEELGI